MSATSTQIRTATGSRAVVPARDSSVGKDASDRIAGYAGIAFILLSLASFAPGRPPAFDASVTKLAGYAGAKDTVLLASAWLSLLSLPALLMLVTRLRDRMAVAGGPVATLARFFHAAYSSALAIAGVAFVVAALPAFEHARLGQTSDTAVRMSVDLSTLLFSLHLVVVTVAVVTISLAIVKTGDLPRWVGMSGGLVAIGTLTASFGIFSTGVIKVLLVVAYLPGLVWWLCVSIMVLRSSRSGRS